MDNLDTFPNALCFPSHITAVRGMVENYKSDGVILLAQIHSFPSEAKSQLCRLASEAVVLPLGPRRPYLLP